MTNIVLSILLARTAPIFMSYSRIVTRAFPIIKLYSFKYCINNFIIRIELPSFFSKNLNHLSKTYRLYRKTYGHLHPFCAYEYLLYKIFD